MSSRGSQGTTDKGAFCETCGHNTQDCVGHYAYIKLILPVFHIGYFRHIISILQQICKASILCTYSTTLRGLTVLTKTCARVMLPESERRIFLKRFRRPNLENLARQRLCKAVNTATRKVVFCPYCGATNGAVKKQGTLKIVHDKFRAKKSADEMEKWKASFGNAIQQQKELSIFVGRAASEDLNALKVLDLFRRISAEVGWDAFAVNLYTI